MVNQVVHANTPSFPSTWLTDTYALDPFGMSRPASITTTASGGAQRWATGAYGFDGAGNIKSMGTHTFGYDKVSRLTAANLYLEPTTSASLRFQTFSYDAFGNLQSIAGSSARSTPTSSSTNRLTGAGYDAQGNVTGWNGNLYEYDPFNLMWHYKTATAGDEWVYLYTADDERVWSYKVDNTSLWTLREPGGSVLRENTTNGTWIVQSDYIYRDGALLAAETASGLRHFHLDHLGTPRLVSNDTGLQAAYHVYYPYGEEATAFNQDTSRAKFTGHERDLGNLGGSGDDLDYMHARFCSPLTGRFWSTDAADGSARSPQSWNLFSYVMGNPMKYTDPTGMFWQVYHEFPADGMTVSDYGEAYGITVTTSAWRGTTTNPLTGAAGLNTLIAGRATLNSIAASGPRDPLQMVRGFYQNRFEQMAVEGNYLAAFIDFVGLELVIPQSYGDVGAQLAMTVLLPEIKLGKTAGELIHARLKRSLSYHSELEHLTYKDILNLAGAKGPQRQAARDMKKLIEQTPRLMEKEGNPFGEPRGSAQWMTR